MGKNEKDLIYFARKNSEKVAKAQKWFIPKIVKTFSLLFLFFHLELRR
jgi:hypothetical protein